MSARTFVSPTGNDLNPCSLAAPCRNFQAALTQTNPGGEIAVLGTAGYGGDAPFVIDRAVSIVNEGGYEAGIAVQSGVAGIVINAGATDAVSLRGLTIDGNGIGKYGIQFNSGKSLTVDNCVIRHLNGDGIHFFPNATSNLSVSNSVASDNSGNGVIVNPIGTTNVNGVLNHVSLNNNGFAGLNVVGNDAAAFFISAIAVIDSVASNNGSSNNGGGFIAQSASGPMAILLVRSAATSNPSNGIVAFGANALVTVDQSAIFANASGWLATNGGTIRNYGNNAVANNFGNETPQSSATLE